ncbi:hypothetical protein CEXT_588471 [Caerostris extrusa]|uniref:Uncharacterized protein n=1 Tax=Caerostris extrusa TaxID=172846 RepID=A0AAV4UB40_CAEEX|nr:hypothetical protein CEXT_588471 [Caerostris extrusa]
MVAFYTMSSEECSAKIGEKEPMLNHSRDETPAAPPVRNRRQSAIDRAARLVDIHHTVVHVSTEIAVAVHRTRQRLEYVLLNLVSAIVNCFIRLDTVLTSVLATFSNQNALRFFIWIQVGTLRWLLKKFYLVPLHPVFCKVRNMHRAIVLLKCATF